MSESAMEPATGCCPNCTRPEARQVVLIDGGTRCSYCPDWMHECEARAVLAMQPLAARRSYLYGTPDRWGQLRGGIAQRRGQDALRRLEATMTALWERARSSKEVS